MACVSAGKRLDTVMFVTGLSAILLIGTSWSEFRATTLAIPNWELSRLSGDPLLAAFIMCLVTASLRAVK